MTEKSKERRILDAMQLGTYYSVFVKNHHNREMHLRVPIDQTIVVDDIVLFAAYMEGTKDDRGHTYETTVFDYGQVVKVHGTPHKDAQYWMIQKVELEAWEERNKHEAKALEEIINMEAQRDHQAIMASYGENLPDNLKESFAALQGKFQGNPALSAPLAGKTADDAETAPTPDDAIPAAAPPADSILNSDE